MGALCGDSLYYLISDAQTLPRVSGRINNCNSDKAAPKVYLISPKVCQCKFIPKQCPNLVAAIDEAMSSTISQKILRTANAPQTPPDETEKAVAQALIDLENNMPDLKTELRALQISAAREVDVKGGKKAIVVFVPVPFLKAFRKIQPRCVTV